MPVAAIDHDYWGRPEEQRTSRPAWVWNRTTAASDLLGMVRTLCSHCVRVWPDGHAVLLLGMLYGWKGLWHAAPAATPGALLPSAHPTLLRLLASRPQASAALSSTSLLFSSSQPAYAAVLLGKARQLYAWGAAVPGQRRRHVSTWRLACRAALCHSAAPACRCAGSPQRLRSFGRMPGCPTPLPRLCPQGSTVTACRDTPQDLYESNRYHDKLMLAAAWLHRATGAHPPPPRRVASVPASPSQRPGLAHCCVRMRSCCLLACEPGPPCSLLPGLQAMPATWMRHTGTSSRPLLITSRHTPVSREEG